MVTIVIILWMAWFITTDVIYAAKGQMPPRKRVRLAEIKAGTKQRRYGLRGWWTDLLDDALRAETTRRRDKAAEQAEQVRAERKAAKKQARQAVDPGPAPATAVPADQGPAPAAATGPAPDPAATERRWESTVIHDDHTYCVKPGCPTCRPPRHGWHCKRCGTRHEGFATEAEARADAAGHPCPPAEQVPTQTAGPAPATATPAPPAGGTGPAASTTSGDDAGDGPLAPVIPMFPNGTHPGADNTEKESDMSQPVAEVTGLQSAINYADGVASAHAAHGAAEGFAASLAEAEYGPGVLGAVAAAQEASTNAGAAWDVAAAKLREALAVKEAYDQVPDAGSKAHVTSE